MSRSLSEPGVPRDENLKEEITRRLAAYCAEHGYILSEAKESLINDLIRMHNLLGNFYCPCQVGNIPETVCICSLQVQGSPSQGKAPCPYRSILDRGSLASVSPRKPRLGDSEDRSADKWLFRLDRDPSAELRTCDSRGLSGGLFS